MKVSPGLAVICHDDAVAQHRGASGDGAPVAAGLADHRGRLARDRRLVDRGDALDDVAVAGDDLPGLDDHAVAQREGRAGDQFLGTGGEQPPGHRLRTCLAQRVGLRLAAPFGDGLGEVGEDDGRARARPSPRSRRRSGVTIEMTVVRTEPTQTTNMTGLRKTWRGSSLTRACGSECQAVTSERRVCRTRVLAHESASAIEPSASDGKYVSPATTMMMTMRKPTKLAVWVGIVPAVDRPTLLLGHAAGEAEHGDDRYEPAEEHAHGERDVEERLVGGQAREGGAVVVRGRRERVEHLGQPVRPVGGERAGRDRERERQAGAEEHQGGRDEDRQRRVRDLTPADRLPQQLRACGRP